MLILCKNAHSDYRNKFICISKYHIWSSGKLHNLVITEPEVLVPLIFQLIACYEKGGTTPHLESGSFKLLFIFITAGMNNHISTYVLLCFMLIDMAGWCPL